MVRNVKSHHEEQEDEDEEFFSRTTESTAQKANALRSKHSETEQRRRSKINERFQILRDLIPQNDQKRDKASCLLEVIQYIQFLQEKLQMYEGSYQGWSQEPSKLMHWNSVESDLDDAAYKALDHPAVVANQAFPSNFPAPSSVLGDVPIQLHQASVSSSENLASLSQSQFWQSRACTTESAVPGHALNKEEELKTESGEASISDAYSQGLLNNLIQELQSSGVDLTQASISVQLDVGKRANTGLTATMSSAKDHQKQRPGTQSRTSYGVGTSFEDSDQAYKRLRTEHI